MGRDVVGEDVSVSVGRGPDIQVRIAAEKVEKKF